MISPTTFFKVSRSSILKNLIEAARLVREGRLQEAAALMQQGTTLPEFNAVLNDREAVAAPHMSTWLDSFSRQAGVKAELGGISGVAKKIIGKLADVVEKRMPAAPVPASTEGVFETRTFRAGTLSGDYKIYVPSTYRGDRASLVVMLHGCTQSPSDFAAGTRMNEHAEGEMCIVIYPEQTQAANVSRCWNWFQSANQKRDSGEAALIAGMTRRVMQDFNIDPARVYVAGLSAGGAAAAIMASTYPDLYAAACVHSGLACGAARDMQSAFGAMRGGGSVAAVTGKSAASSNVPTIVFHGDNDNTVNAINGDQVIAQYKTNSQLVEIETSGETASGMKYTRTQHVDANGQAMLEHWTLHGAGHAWFGGSSDGTYTDPRGLDASSEMLRFFREHKNPRAVPG
jgi:poly(hydroxyalkanoate) depolymerase family esterase